MREVVTIQVGGFANYVGSHFWNFQDELLGLAEEPHGNPIYKIPSIDMDVLYRTGGTIQMIGLPSLNSSKASAYLCIDDAKPFHCSSIYAAALHSLALPFWMELSGPSVESNHISGAVDINGLTHMLADQARQNMVAILDVAMPAPSLTGGQSKGHLQGSLHSLTPEIAEDGEDLQVVESMVVHGAFQSEGGDRGYGRNIVEDGDDTGSFFAGII